MAVHSIPLFRIPFLALRIILGRFVPHEIIQLSLCSKRSLRVAKKCWKKKGVVKAALFAESTPRIEVSYNSTSDYTFPIYSLERLWDRKAPNIRVGDAVVPSIHGLTETKTFWQDKVFGIEQTVRYIRDLFDAPISLIELKRQKTRNEFIRIIDVIMSMQDSVANCRFHQMNPMDDCLRYFLDNCKITGNLEIYGGPSRQFRHNWNIHLEDLYISNSVSLTLQNLMNIDCQTLQLFGPSLTSEDLNQFLKHWQQGGNSRMRYASIVINSLDQRTITSGIDTVSQPRELHRYYRSINNSEITKMGGLDIRRNDGTIATIFTHHITFEFAVDPEMFRRED